jgi:hypothetical protein
VRRGVGALAASIALAAFATAARAQDFAGALPPASGGALELLERALPGGSTGVEAAAASTRWWGLRELETRAAALGGGWRGLRAAAGLSQTGAPELGWTTLGLAAGAAAPGAGAALRACARRDRSAPWSARHALAPEAGLELGAGAWLEPVPDLRAWASAPQLAVTGEPPPLARTLEVGVRAGRGTSAWCVLRAPRSGDDGERALGASLALAPLVAWAEVRDAPLRGSAGLRAGAGPLAVSVRVDSHPALGETLRLVLDWRAGVREAP